MVKLVPKKVGIIACSGEELPEGTVSRVAALKVLEELRPEDTVTLCLPLFLAGDERERAFARFYPTIALDGCEKRCAQRATERYSGQTADSLVISQLVEEQRLPRPQGRRRLDGGGDRVVQAVAEELATRVDRILGEKGRLGLKITKPEGTPATTGATCACVTGIPVTQVEIGGVKVELVGLSAIFEQFYQTDKRPGDGLAEELLQTVKLYNRVPEKANELYKMALVREYEIFCRQKEG